MLEWQFEHFKTFYNFPIMQQTAACLLLFEGQSPEATKNLKLNQLTDMLIESTGHKAWKPARDMGNLNIDDEGGSIFRNKARLLSSFYICVPFDLLTESNMDKQIVLTPFGKALGLGYIEEGDFFNFIIKKFQYPNPAFSNYKDWVASGIVIRPFILILKSLVFLYENYGLEQSYLTNKEVCSYLVPLKNESSEIAMNTLIDHRKKNILPPANNQDPRKVKEILFFLSMSKYVYIDTTTSSEEFFRLNLIDFHSKEKTYFFESRSAGGAGYGKKKFRESKLEKIKKLWKD
ncbi:hypothetical protein [Shouchella rhizosphaerae]|uniref:hypothetical protein n=1 Tax=Shouchella rhizosphaerae TaxID=866786 RepID=UPI0020402584|nr:hypothetical protein [Shouchella rhizosphaerae]MCM3382139.1 hypothetical protein [Shouchella rhizosphaerae]